MDRRVKFGLVVAGAFVVSRVLYYLLGVRFDMTTLLWYWQFIDPALLKMHFWQSLWYLHSQPPAFNFFLGVVVNLFPGNEMVIFAVCYLVMDRS